MAEAGGGASAHVPNMAQTPKRARHESTANDPNQTPPMKKHKDGGGSKHNQEGATQHRAITYGQLTEIKDSLITTKDELKDVMWQNRAAAHRLQKMSLKLGSNLYGTG